MLKKAPYFIVLLVLFGVVYSCSKKAKQEVKLSENFAQGKPIEYEIKENEKFASIEVYAKIKPFVDSLKAQYDTVKYFTDLDTNFLFYVKNGNKMGVVDKNAKIIIPVEYDKIYNLGGTANGCIEVEQNKKRGLYTPRGQQLLAAEYQSIYPFVEDGDVIVQVKKDNAFGVLLEDGTLLFDTTATSQSEYYISPFISQAAKGWKINVNDDDIYFLQPINYVRYENDPIVGRAVVITPSYLADLGFYPAIIENIIIEKDADFGVAESKGKVKEVTTLWDNIKLAFAEYYEVGLDARGYETEKNSLITLDKNGKVISQVEYYRPYMPTTPCDDELYSSKFIDSSLYEVKSYTYSDGEENPYYAHKEYYHYRINTSGVITKLENKRQYSFTKYVPITEEYIKGCYVSTQSSSNAYAAGDGKVKTQEYLTVEDMEVMKNEIYADYGFKFKTPKWQEYFKKKEWYKPVFASVESLLTEIDKHNIAFINNMIEKMKANPKKYNETNTGSIYLFP